MQALLREKALNTGELLRQHRELQQKFQLTTEELSQEKAALEEAAAEVYAAKQAAAMTNKWGLLPPSHGSACPVAAISLVRNGHVHLKHVGDGRLPSLAFHASDAPTA